MTNIFQYIFQYVAPMELWPKKLWFDEIVLWRKCILNMSSVKHCGDVTGASWCPKSLTKRLCIRQIITYSLQWCLMNVKESQITTGLFVAKLIQTDKKNIKCPHNRPFVWGIHQRPVHPSPKVMADFFFRDKNWHDALIQFVRFLVGAYNTCTCSFSVQNILTFCINPFCTGVLNAISVILFKSSLKSSLISLSEIWQIQMKLLKLYS